MQRLIALELCLSSCVHVFIDLFPLMKRLENYQKPCNNDSHGYDGPIAISNGGQIMPVAQDFLRASHAIGVPYSGTPFVAS